jgi:uncharacterized protein (DUF58 family)
MIISFAYPFLAFFAWGLLAAYLLICIAECVILFKTKQPITAERHFANFLSLGDTNDIQLLIRSRIDINVDLEIRDELPMQLTIRDFNLCTNLFARESKMIVYRITPLIRGAYNFGKLNVFISLKFPAIIMRKIAFDLEATAKVYPSVLQMKRFELMAMSKTNLIPGGRKRHRLGQSYEFDQIKTYIPGDDFRSLNWKATGRSGQLMVNRYEDEKAQQVYAIIENGRNMYMPFNGLSMFDHSLNAALILLNLALKKGDRTGLVTYSKKVNGWIKADNKHGQIKSILEKMYKEQLDSAEPDSDALYAFFQKQVKNRSLLFFFTNAELMQALDRRLPALMKLHLRHKLIVVMFENSELKKLLSKKSVKIEDMMTRSLAEKYLYQKEIMAYKIKSLGVNCILTTPEELNLNIVNAYLDVKTMCLV